MKKATRIAVWAGFAGGAAAIATLSPLVELSPVSAAPASKTKVTKTSTKKPLPRYLTVKQLDLLRKARGGGPSPRLVPTAGGEFLPKTLKTLPGVIPVGNFNGDVTKLPTLKSRQVSTRVSNQRRTPRLPRPVPPATINRRASRPAAVPRWVRYPLEFQLCGIGLGTRAVDKDRFNRIDRYGLFAMHGNPTAVVVPIVTQQAAGGAGGPGGSPGGAPGGFPGGPGAGGPGGGASLPTATVATSTLTVQQTPPLAGASLFPGDQNGNLPDWASAVTVQLDNNHVQWLYKRDTYAMGFVVDRLGYVDAIVVAGTESPIAKTQLEDPVHTVKLGDDLRKVMFRYGYPDTVETYPVNVSASVTAGGAVNPGGITPPAPAVAPGGFPGAPGAEGAAGAAVQGGNGVFRTFEVRYEQSYNVVFTIRNNRVARIYIFGDPDFFNAQRRQRFRTAY